MSDRRKAKMFIEAADAGVAPAGAPAEMALLLGAVALLKESAPAPVKPDAEFAASLRTNLTARYDELVSGDEAAPQAPKSAARRWAWLAAPALAAAAAVIILLVLGVFTTPGPPAVATLRVSTGRATVVDQSGKSHTVTGSRGVAADESVRVPGSSRAVLTFKNHNIARLEAGTRVTINGYGARTVALLLDAGKVYNRVVNRTAYSVVHNGVTVRATGTAFDVEAQEKGLAAFVFEGAVKVSWANSGRVYDVGQGAVAIVTPKGSGFDIQIRSFDLKELDFSWLAYNRDLDRKGGFPLGALVPLTPTPPQGVQPPAAPVTPQQTTPGQQTTPQTPETTPQTQPTTPETTPETTPQRAPQTQPVKPPAPPPLKTLSISLDGAAGISGMTLKWGSSGNIPVDEWVVQRNDGTSGFVDYASLAGGSAGGSFFDPKVDPKHQYFWRVAAISNGNVAARSNTVSNF